jgi:uncharacterized protein YsxB (DUF464 family)
MTEVVFKKENGIIVSGRVSGHSGYAEEGSDIVCASVSSVLWCILSGLESFLGDKIKVCQEDADVSFEIKGLTESEIEKADLLLSSMDNFFTELSKQYSQFISKSEV